MDKGWRRKCSVSDVLMGVYEGGGCVGLELRGSSSQDTNLEVISSLAGGSSAHAWPSVGLPSGQAALRS